MSVLDQFGGKRRRKDNGDPPISSERPLDALDVVPRRYRSEAAERAAVEERSLEQELRDAKAKYEVEVAELKTRIYELQGEVQTLRTANNILNTDCETLRLRGEADHNLLVATKAKWEIGAKIYLELLDQAPKTEPVINMDTMAAAVAEEPK